MAVRREVASDLCSIVNAPPGFMEQATRAIDLIPDEWDTVYVAPHFVLDDNGFPTEPVEYLGAGFEFFKADKYVAFLTEMPADLVDDHLRAVLCRHVHAAFEKAGVV